MKFQSKMWTGTGALICLFVLIIDSKTALSGAKDGLELSLRTVIPSLFPFFIFSYLINKIFIGTQIPIFSSLCRLCNIPRGAESIFILGFLGGYPVGAQCIENAYSGGNLSRKDAQRMLGFCSNAGPAFIFGMASSLFSSQKTLWALWGIHILSAIVVGCILPRRKNSTCIITHNSTVSLSLAVEHSIKTIGYVCGWVIIFRVLISFLQSWFLWLFPSSVQTMIVGFLELTNGCAFISSIPAEGQRFVLCAVLLSIGGLCVAMQTVSVTKKLGTGMYFPGKLLQGIFSFLFAVITQYALFPRSEIFKLHISIPLVLLVFAVSILIALYRTKKVVAIPC